MKIWTGKLNVKGERGKPGPEIDALEPNKVHPESWLRALGETGKDVT